MSETVVQGHGEPIPSREHETEGDVMATSPSEYTEVPSHVPTLFAESLLDVGTLTITNSLLMTWIVVLIVIAISFSIRLSLKLVPTGIQNLFEMIVEGALSIADSVTSDRVKTMKFFPVVFAIFIFVLLNNWLGLIPGVGTVGFTDVHNGHNVFIPFFRGGTADLNTTLALAIFAVVASHVIGVVMAGAWNHLNRFININALLEIPKKITKDPMVILVNPIKIFVGLIEVIGEVAKAASLSFRLFGNIFAGEVLLASMAAIFAFALPIPFYFLEVMVGVIQALIFAMLVLAYFTIFSSAEEH
jgi:F-type H+-transporting ATPase subunit a